MRVHIGDKVFCAVSPGGGTGGEQGGNRGLGWKKSRGALTSIQNPGVSLRSSLQYYI